MAFFYPLCVPMQQICTNTYSLVSHQQPQFQTTTILISNAQSPSSSSPKNDVDISNINTNTLILDQTSSHQIKTVGKVLIKQSKKEQNLKQDQNFGCRNQNKDRNVLSGILKGYIQFTMKSLKLREMIENLSKKMDLENGLKIFYKFLGETFPQRKTYVGIKSFKKFLRGQGVGEGIAKQLATSLKYYLSEVYPLQLNVANKQTKKAKIVLLKKVRKLRLNLFQS